jgi:hypothetical protein
MLNIIFRNFCRDTGIESYKSFEYKISSIFALVSGRPIFTANWNSNDFLGRPEPIYTYKNTSRTGTLTWKIVVDHPSVLNVIVNKVLSNETNKTRVDSILESFFAGCRKYDLYELAKKYYTIPPNDLFNIQEVITSKQESREQLRYILNDITNDAQVSEVNGSGSAPQNNFGQFVNKAFYFNNNQPEPKSPNQSFSSLYTSYVSQPTIDNYKKQSKTSSGDTTLFFDTVITKNKTAIDELIDELFKQFNKSINNYQ